AILSANRTAPRRRALLRSVPRWFPSLPGNRSRLIRYAGHGAQAADRQSECRGLARHSAHFQFVPSTSRLTPATSFMVGDPVPSWRRVSCLLHGARGRSAPTRSSTVDEAETGLKSALAVKIFGSDLK